MDKEKSVFTKMPRERYLIETDRFFVVEDGYPVSPGHCLIISKEQKADFFELDDAERHELIDLVQKVRDHIEKSHSPQGFNIGINCGEVAGQTVMHFHCHVIPRYEGDMENPAGGVRHCVEGKGYY